MLTATQYKRSARPLLSYTAELAVLLKDVALDVEEGINQASGERTFRVVRVPSPTTTEVPRG